MAHRKTDIFGRSGKRVPHLYRSYRGKQHRIRAHLHVERRAPGRLLERRFERCALNVSSGGASHRSAGRLLAPLSYPTHRRVLSRRSFQKGKRQNDTHTEVGRLSTRTAAFETSTSSSCSTPGMSNKLYRKSDSSQYTRRNRTMNTSSAPRPLRPGPSRAKGGQK